MTQNESTPIEPEDTRVTTGAGVASTAPAGTGGGNGQAAVNGGPVAERPTVAPAPPFPDATPTAAIRVPIPGPPAAPPPWRRLPDGGAAAPPPRSDSPAPLVGGLLDAPTAFIQRPGPAARAAGGAAPPGPRSPGSEPEGGWSEVHAVRNRTPRQAALQLKRLDPWSVLKLALVLAVVLFFIWLVAVGVLYGILDGMGVWDRLNGTYADLVSGAAQTGSSLISAGRVFGIAAVVGAINSLLFAVAVTVGAFVYNVSADLVGGIEVTLSERD